MSAEFVAKQGFGFKLVHLSYQNSITPQGKFLVKREVRKFKGYFLGLSLFEKHIIANAICPRFEMGGGGGEPSTLHITTEYRIFGKKFFATHRKEPIFHPFHLYYHYYRCDSYNNYFYPMDIGRYISTSPNINAEILALCRGLSETNKAWLLRQIARMKQCYEGKIANYTHLDEREIRQIERIYTEFLPNIHKLSDTLYAYKGYFLPINHFEISVFWHKHNLEVLEKSTLAKMRQKDFIDVGGFVGDSAIIFEREFCDKNVYTFEPTKQNYERTLQTLKLNNSKRVIPINKGLGAEQGKIEIGIANRFDGSGSSIVFLDRVGYIDQKEIAHITTLDEFVAEHNIEVGFIKVDIEGAEMQFLQGAKETICIQKPAMLLSIYHQPGDYFGIKPLIESWNLGYSFKTHKGVDFGIREETVLFCEVLE